jgi:hypothetical protein
VHFGEGDYSGTEQLIRKLLASAHPGLRLPPATNVPNRTPGGEMNPETYVGYERLQYLDTSGAAVVKNAPAAYFFPKRLPLGAMGLSGTWTIHAQEATAGHGAALELRFLAKDVYLVLGGRGTVGESINGHHVATVTVGSVPKLYTLRHASATSSGTMLLRMSPGVQAYAFTFG